MARTTAKQRRERREFWQGALTLLVVASIAIPAAALLGHVLASSL